MHLALHHDSSPDITTTGKRHPDARALYFGLLEERGADIGDVHELSAAASRSLLVNKLRLAQTVDVEFPSDLRSLTPWLEQEHVRTSMAYRAYLDARQAGAPRRYFRNRAHALHFIRAVAPTKLVDGAWLYGLLPLWRDQRLAPLIRIYLEELGDGAPSRHHVLLYQALLARYGCEGWQDLPDAHFTQGAIQLALAHHTAEFLPEVIGFNLGYEQLPLHLPITAYELNELEVDPYYFALHVTIDNASTGHARKSLQCVLDCMPRTGDMAEFHRRVANGYRLNFVGMGTNDAIAGFDLERELLAVFEAKAAVGAMLHSDYCRIGGRTVSDWLSAPGQLPLFLATLQSTGWIERGRAPEQSRFWRLLTDDRAPMFGVFDAYEQQLLRDWIAGDAAATSPARAVNRFRQRPQAPGRQGEPDPPADTATVREVITHHLAQAEGSCAADDIRWLRDRLADAGTRAQALERLRGLLSPANHPTPVGLLATRLYASLLARPGHDE